VLTAELVARAVAEAGIDSVPRFDESTGSTNTDLTALGGAGAPEWTVAVANEQTAGRGRLGRSWESRRGLTLPVSVLLRPRVAGSEVPLLSLAAGVAMAEACRQAVAVEVRCKWPNDLVVGGRKLGGILTEASVEGGVVAFAVIGTGVNLLHGRDDFPEDLRLPATSVALEGGHPDFEALLRAYLAGLRELYGEAGTGLATTAVSRYRPLCDTIGRRVRARTLGGEVLDGQAVGVGERGELLLQTEGGGTERVAFGEVEHLDAGS
jgi:BirA family transcriptional regulator, biotin operon repressor / biotin---[acetyl-CoA-carboxylase] ligase